MKRLREQLKWLEKIIYFDEDDYLREKANDREVLQGLIDDAERVLNQTNDNDKLYFLFGTLGNLYRVKEEPKQAIQYLNQAFELAAPDSREEIITLIRLGEAYKYDNEHGQAFKLFERALLKCYETERGYLDFAFQHKGKCLMEVGRLSEAMEAFQGALAIRKNKGKQSLIYSTEQAINYLKKLGETYD
ncbi:tetratricopeptide repeat protein [Filobacillus milosensis]|uniref:Tetratricopeptide repeat protein n=1 Tax=Filobacillus milosensis TaxID=94137 RepID=A0A4Y8IQ57_9BACI|nr:tetratricopeptide repeat protein [Filobacillus milosensis]TFB22806.1 tetratricopeptide repeat protein [Filobacillus milosensis]